MEDVLAWPAEKLRLYQALYALEPWGCEADNHRTALLSHVTAATHGSKSKLKDFLLRWDAPEDDESDGGFDQFVADMSAFSAAQSRGLVA